MKETSLHLIWSEGLLNRNRFKGIEGEDITVIFPGQLNSNSGPDFLNASLIINGIYWYGNIEMHINSSNYSDHNHHLDHAYNNLILHVVFRNNANLELNCPTISLEEYISEMEIENIVSKHIASNYFLNNTAFNNTFNTDKSVIEELAISRLERKSRCLDEFLKISKNNWQRIFYLMLFRNMGFNVNSLPFEWLFTSLKLSQIFSLSNSKYGLEALLFGQSSLLDRNGQSNYERHLNLLYTGIKEKYKLQSINKSSWSFLRLRPLNFPTIRIAQLASLMYKNNNMIFDVLECKDVDECCELFKCSASSYWNEHYHFNSKSHYKVKSIGKNAIDSILINTVIPYKYLYEKKHNQKGREYRALSMLKEISSESNNSTKIWKNRGYILKNAIDSQALIEVISPNQF